MLLSAPGSILLAAIAMALATGFFIVAVMSSANRMMVWLLNDPSLDKSEPIQSPVQCEKFRCGYVNHPEAHYCALCGQPLKKAAA